MLKVVLKHYIYEICINLIFSQIDRNFPVINNTRDRLLQIYYDLMEKYFHSRNQDIYTYEYFVNDKEDLSTYELIIDITSMIKIMENEVRYEKGDIINEAVD